MQWWIGLIILIAIILAFILIKRKMDNDAAVEAISKLADAISTTSTKK